MVLRECARKSLSSIGIFVCACLVTIGSCASSIPKPPDCDYWPTLIDVPYINSYSPSNSINDSNIGTVPDTILASPNAEKEAPTPIFSTPTPYELLFNPVNAPNSIDAEPSAHIPTPTVVPEHSIQPLAIASTVPNDVNPYASSPSDYANPSLKVPTKVASPHFNPIDNEEPDSPDSAAPQSIVLIVPEAAIAVPASGLNLYVASDATSTIETINATVFQTVTVSTAGTLIYALPSLTHLDAIQVTSAATVNGTIAIQLSKSE